MTEAGGGQAMDVEGNGNGHRFARRNGADGERGDGTPSNGGRFVFRRTNGGDGTPPSGGRLMFRRGGGNGDGDGPARGDGLLLLAPLRLEAGALRRGAPAAHVVRTGMGPRRAAAAGERARSLPGAAVAVAGFCGALDPALEPGDLIVATELRRADGQAIPVPAAELVAALLRRAGLDVRTGPVACADAIVRGAERARLHADGALAADMESAWLAPAAGDRPFAVLRAVVDTPTRELRRPLHTAAGAARAWRALQQASAALAEWAAAVEPRRVLLGAPRASCAGVERAIDMVEHSLHPDGSPLYVRKHIVHNSHVVADLESRGAVFVDELTDVPEGATVVFSAHGVSPAVRAEASGRDLRVIDATCPLVGKVHGEARRFAAAGYTVLLIGHAGHDEVAGTLGEAPDAIRLVQSLEEAATVEVADPERVAYLTQTTLAVDETREIVDALRRRFPALVGPAKDDICFATQNRQDAVKALAADCDAILVVGSESSSNSKRLVEVAERAGCRATLIEDESELDLAWLAGVRTIGLTAGASAPERVVQRVLKALHALGATAVDEREVTRETIQFRLPNEMR